MTPRGRVAVFASSPAADLARIGVFRLATRSRMRSSRCDIGCKRRGERRYGVYPGAGEGGTRQRWDLFIPHLRYPSGLMWDWCGGGRTCWTLSCCPVLTSPAPGVGAKVTCSEVTCDAGGMAFSLFPYIPDGVACGTPPPMPAMRWGEKGGAIDRAPAARVFARASGGGRAQLNAARSRAFVSASASVRSQVERQVVARGVFRFVTEGNFTTVPRVPLES